MKKAKVIAFYLPQYHHIPENDRWYGRGFTEWTSVAKAKPLFKGHYQPRIPADLGFYDLRVPEVREEQAELAKEAGIDAFCYYHYWFGNNKQLLEKPLQEVVRLGKPDFPFCLCWANHTWYKKTWDSDTSTLNLKEIMPQEYPGKEDIEQHFYVLLSTFKDERYYKIKGKLAFVIYNVKDLPNVDEFKTIWEDLAVKNQLPGFFWIAYTAEISDLNTERFKKFDSTILSLTLSFFVKQRKGGVSKIVSIAKELLGKLRSKPAFVYKYKDVYHNFVAPICKSEKVYPVIIPNWDNSPRRKTGAVIYTDSTPKLFKKHVEEALDLIKDKTEDDKILFLKSWNEWGEGNYMEPDLKYGKGYIHALREALYE